MVWQKLINARALGSGFIPGRKRVKWARECGGDGEAEGDGATLKNAGAGRKGRKKEGVH